MTFDARAGENDLPLSDWKRIDLLCDRFEASIRAGERPEMAHFLREIEGRARSLLFRELLTIELESVRARGARPEAPAYHERFPEYSQAIEEAFIAAKLDGTTMQPRRNRPSVASLSGMSKSRLTRLDGELYRAELNPVVMAALNAEGYEVVDELGRGGMGVVYLARKIALGRLCALKMILAGAHAGAAALARFRAEAAAIARLQHPDIVQIYHVGEADGLPYLELEYLPGGGLDQVLDGTPRPPEDAARLVEVMARAISEAHRQAIVHRDLKPANILLDATGRPKVADFGLAKTLGSDDGITKSQAVLGSPSYMAPEQAEGDVRSVGPAADVYALGAILYELLTGRPPFRAATALLTLAQVKESDPVPPSRFQPGLPGDVETICLKCLEKTPARRYPTADALAEDLRRFLAGEPILAKPVPSWVRAWKWARRRKALAAALTGITALILLLLSGALYYNSRLQVSVREARAAHDEAVAQRNQTFRNLNQLVFEVHDKLAKNPATRAARRELLDTALAGLEEVAASAESAAPDKARAVAHQKLGDIFREISRLEEARKQYEAARGLAEELARASPLDWAITECLGHTYAGLGDLSLHGDRLDEAVENFQRVVALAEANREINPDQASAQQTLLDAYFRLGRAYGFDRKLDKSAEWFSKMRQEAERWAKDEPGNGLCRDLLSTSYRKLADCWKLGGDMASARKDYLKAVALGTDVVAAEPLNPEYKLHLALALDDLAMTQYHLGQLEAAWERSKHAVQLYAELVKADPDDVDNQVRFVQTRFNLGRLEMDRLDLTAAAFDLRTARDGLAKLDRDGKLEGRPRDKSQLFPHFEAELAACESVASLSAPFHANSDDAAHAARLLRIRAGLLARVNHSAELDQVAGALLTLDSDRPEDLFEIGRSLAWCSGRIDENNWSTQGEKEFGKLRSRFADRAVGELVKAIDRGLTFPHRLDDDVFLDPIRRQPGFRQITERLKAPNLPHDPPAS